MLHSTSLSNSGNTEVGSVWFGNRVMGLLVTSVSMELILIQK